MQEVTTKTEAPAIAAQPKVLSVEEALASYHERVGELKRLLLAQAEALTAGVSAGLPPTPPPVVTPVAQGDNGPMELRVSRLEQFAEKATERLAALAQDLAIIKSNYSTKEDLHKEMHALTWKVVGACAALTAAVFWIAKNVQ